MHLDEWLFKNFTCCYINDNLNTANFALISALQISVNTTANTNPEIAQGFFSEFFPLLPDYLVPLPNLKKIHSNQLPMALKFLEKITRAEFSATPLKKTRPDTIFTLVWQKYGQ